MPYIQIRTNKEITKEKEVEIKKRLGDAIAILGKSETWLMVEFVSNAHLYFRGEDTENYAYVDVKLYGNGGDFNSFTGEVSNILEGNLDILPRNIYISYAAFNDWGNNGSNF